mgnify:CR=1 FL=1
MYLYGTSGYAKVIIDILGANHEPIEALFDDNVEVTSLLGHPVLKKWTKKKRGCCIALLSE